MMEVHVSPDGRDGSAGTVDSPLQTIQAGCRRCEELFSRTLEAPVTLYLHGGTYYLPETLHLQTKFPLVIRPWRNEAVSIEGGIVLSGWKKDTLGGRPVLSAELPCGIGEFNQLYVNGKPRNAARYPKQGFLRVKASPGEVRIPAEAPLPGREDHFEVCEGDFDPQWYDIGNIRLCMNHYWVNEHLKVESFDPDGNVLYTQSEFCLRPKGCMTDYCFLNVREALSESGEYYYDRRNNMIYYLPAAGEDADNICAVIPQRGALMCIAGARWLTLDSLQFRYAGAWMPRCGTYFDLHEQAAEAICNTAFMSTENRKKPCYSGAQAALQLPGILMFEHAENCAVRNCTVAQSGWYGVCIASGCRNIRLEGNEFSGLGGGGIRVSGANYGQAVNNGRPELQTDHIIIQRNHIHDCGEIYLSAVGILITDAWGCLVEHNHIHDLYYSGISCGWSWGFGNSITRENRIGWNLIHDLGKGVLSDMGGIYTLGIQPGTRIYHNVIFNIRKRHYGGWGIYTDEGSSHIVIENNLVYDCSCEAFNQHYGRENIVRGNIFAFGEDACVSNTRAWDRCYTMPGENLSKTVTLTGNVFITDRKPFYRIDFEDLIKEKRMACEDNFFFDLSGETATFCLRTNGIAEQKYDESLWRESGFDRHSICRDPGMFDPGARDFRLRENSVLREFGFEEWDFSLAGTGK